MSNNLKPCHWCGKLSFLKHEKVGGHSFWSVECKSEDECPVILVSHDFNSKVEAIEAWNKREHC